jgi:hypothetical protein
MKRTGDGLQGGEGRLKRLDRHGIDGVVMGCLHHHRANSGFQAYLAASRRQHHCNAFIDILLLSHIVINPELFGTLRVGHPDSVRLPLGASLILKMPVVNRKPNWFQRQRISSNLYPFLTSPLWPFIPFVASTHPHCRCDGLSFLFASSPLIASQQLLTLLTPFFVCLLATLLGAQLEPHPSSTCRVRCCHLSRALVVDICFH